MTKIDNLAFDFAKGACDYFPKFGILFCFGWYATKECHSMKILKNGTLTIENKISSKYEHRFVLSLASYRGSPFVTGSDKPNHNITELLNINQMQWETKAEFPSNRY